MRKEIGLRAENRAEVTFTLVGKNQRDLTTRKFSKEWRKAVGIIPGLESLFFHFLAGPGSSAAI
ncbi:MAG: hypothetical protein D6B25_06085 [Desulfobulbaceae bacterium]|nr:MAG: hypothetical protein D6B25_06085 [Desulfobulbaceae bacterium]